MQSIVGIPRICTIPPSIKLELDMPVTCLHEIRHVGHRIIWETPQKVVTNMNISINA